MESGCTDAARSVGCDTSVPAKLNWLPHGRSSRNGPGYRAVSAVPGRGLRGHCAADPCPVPILLTLAGVAIAFVPRVPRIPLAPNLIFLIFLPPLLYAAAWQTNWREFRRNFVYIAMLAFGLVAFTVIGIAEFSDHFITALDWKTGLVLGAVVSTTDAIAASALASRIGLPQHIVDILEGESLINDATGLLALEFGLGVLLRGQAPGAGTGTLRFLWLIGGGIGIGLLIAGIARWLERF